MALCHGRQKIGRGPRCSTSEAPPNLAFLQFCFKIERALLMQCRRLANFLSWAAAWAGTTSTAQPTPASIMTPPSSHTVSAHQDGSVQRLPLIPGVPNSLSVILMRAACLLRCQIQTWTVTSLLC